MGERSLRGPEPWEHRVLRLVSEQSAIPMDQLARFLACGEERAHRVAEHLSKVGFAEYGRFLFEEPRWVWLTARGARFSGTGFAALRPKVGAMGRLRAINEVRLQIATHAPEARWLCGRGIVREQGKRGPRPSAALEIGAERHAILVKQAIGRAERREREILESLMRGYDAVVAFCAPAPQRLYLRLAAEHGWPRLIVRSIPASP